MLRESMQVIENGDARRGSDTGLVLRPVYVWVLCGCSHLEWNLVSTPLRSGSPSFVVISSWIMLAMRITMSSVAQNSYCSGRTLGS